MKVIQDLMMVNYIFCCFSFLSEPNSCRSAEISTVLMICFVPRQTDITKSNEKDGPVVVQETAGGDVAAMDVQPWRIFKVH